MPKLSESCLNLRLLYSSFGHLISYFRFYLSASFLFKFKRLAIRSNGSIGQIEWVNEFDSDFIEIRTCWIIRIRLQKLSEGAFLDFRDLNFFFI